MDDGERRHPRAAAGRQRSAGARLRRRRSGRTSTSWPSPTRRRPATSSASRPISTCRPTASAAWRSGPRRSAARNAFSAGFDWRWVDGDSQEDGLRRRRADRRSPASRRRRRCRCSASPAARSRASAPSSRTSSRRSTSSCSRSARASIAGATTTATTSKPRWRPALPTVNNRPSHSRHATTPSSARTSARSITSSDRVSVWGAVNSGFRAPTLTELYRQFSVGAVTTRPNDQLGARAPGRRRSRHQRRAGAERVRCASPGSHNRLTNPVSNVTLTATLAQKQNVPRDARPGRADRRRLPPRHVLALLGAAMSTTMRR